MTINWDWSVIAYAAPSMLRGTLITIEMSVAAMFFGTLIGAILGVASVFKFWPVRALVAIYVYTVRGVPLLVIIFLIYFALPAAGIYLSTVTAGLMALSIYAGAYITEIFRAGILAVDVGQAEAAKAIGMTERMTLTSVLLPQAIRNIIPPVTNELIKIVKSSSLLSTITISELTRAAQLVVVEKFTPFEIYATLAVYYLVIIGALSYFSRYVEWRLAR
ncbi:MAG: amino acid ABC transporter permease [Devosia sp.]|nr:amino acid ABC transporter permease [Devosia sp.]